MSTKALLWTTMCWVWISIWVCPLRYGFVSPMFVSVFFFFEHTWLLITFRVFSFIFVAPLCHFLLCVRNWRWLRTVDSLQAHQQQRFHTIKSFCCIYQSYLRFSACLAPHWKLFFQWCNLRSALTLDVHNRVGVGSVVLWVLQCRA